MHKILSVIVLVNFWSGLLVSTGFVRKFLSVLPVYYKNKNTLQRCEIEDFVETHFCKLAVCDTPIARSTGCVSSLRYILVGDSGPLELQCSLYQGPNRVMLINLCAWKLQQSSLRGTKSDSCEGKCVSLLIISCK